MGVQKVKKRKIFMFLAFLTQLIYTIQPAMTVLIEGKSVILQTIAAIRNYTYHE